MKGVSYPVILAAIAIPFFILVTLLISNVQYVGGSEDGDYSLLASRVVEGKGFTTDVTSFFFTDYPGLEHPDDTAPPLYPILIAFLFGLLGTNAIYAKMLSLFFGFVVLPFAVYFLGKELVDNRVGFVAALLTLFSPLNLSTAVHAEAEMMFAALVVISVLCFAKALKEYHWWYALGFTLGLAFLAKYTAILLVGAFIITYALLLFSKKARWTWHAIGGALLAGVIITPWIVRNLSVFGDPLYSIHRYVAPQLGLLPVDRAAYLPPTFMEAVSIVGIQALVLKTGVQLLRIVSSPLVIAYALALIGLARTRQRLFIIIFSGIMVAFHTIYWVYSASYFIPLMGLLVIPAVEGVRWIAERISFKHALPALCILAGIFCFFALHTLTTSQAFPFADTPYTVGQLELASWVKTHLDAGEPVFVRLNPWGFAFHSGHPTLQLPERWQMVKTLAKQYGVQYVQCDIPPVPLSDEVVIVYQKAITLCRIL
jgi:4-amino-4-deoxy-L-arabinose transferase-like glycosyltransferase